MENHNFFSSRFAKKTTREKKTQKVYFQRKIKTENYPVLQKNLNTFFNDYSKYFETSFEDNHIVFGKKKSNFRKNSQLGLTDMGSPKSKTKRNIKRPTIRRQVLLRNDSINRSKFTYEDKRKSFEENNLKPGQRFIDDKEIEKLFNLFKELRKINKNRTSHFMNIKDLKELKEAKNERNNFNNKSSENFFKMNTVSSFDKRNFNLDEKKYGTIIMKANTMDIMNESDYNGTISTNLGNTMQEEITKNNNLKSIEIDKEEKHEYICSSDIIKKRKKLIEKQNQYLYKNIQHSLKKQFAESLALQENVFLNQNKNNKFQNHFKKYLNNRLKKQHNSKLLIQDDSHRKNLELKMKIDFLQNKLNPDRIYDWYYDLHSSKSFFPILDTKIETIRNPRNMKEYTKERSKTLDKDDYLKNIITSKYFLNLEKDINNANKNYDCLIVEGKNLLQFENNMAKKLKGRKIINDFERVLSPSKFKNEYIHSNILKKLY